MTGRTKIRIQRGEGRQFYLVTIVGNDFARKPALVAPPCMMTRNLARSIERLLVAIDDLFGHTPRVPTGAELNAACVVEGIQALKDGPLSTFLRGKPDTSPAPSPARYAGDSAERSPWPPKPFIHG